MPEAPVKNAPGTSIWVKLKLAAFAEEPAAIGAMTRKATMESIVQQEFDGRVPSDFTSMTFLPLAYIGIHQIPGRLAAIFRAIGAHRHLVAWIGGAGALSPTRVPGHAVRTYSGRPRSSIRFSTSAAMATSLACLPSVWKCSPLPMTRFHLEMSASTRARQLYPDTLCQPIRPRSAMHRRWASRCVGAVSAVSLGTAFARGGTTTPAAGWRVATSA